jgi:hypothetical protein
MEKTEERKLYTKEDLPEGEISLYMPNKHEKNESLWQKLKEHNKNLKKPESIGEAIAMVVFPGPYSIWKMPPKVHHYFSKALEYAAELSTATPIGPGLYIANAIDRVIYGAKTKSGKQVASGLEGIAAGLEQTDVEDVKPFAKKLREVIGSYFHKFDEVKA